MAAYFIVNVEVKDPERYADYVRTAPQSIAKYGGKYLVRGGTAQKIEGSYEPKRVVILEFESLERAREWWACEEYRAPKALRQATSVTDMILVQGV